MQDKTAEGGPTPPYLLTAKEVADMMRVSKMTVYRMIQNGELDAIRVGRGYRIPASAVRDLLQAI